MSKYDIAPDSDHWIAVREQLGQMQSMLSSSEFNLPKFAQIYEAAAKTILAAVTEVGLSSMRFKAAAKALDLRTKKSPLERFLADD